MHGLRSSHARTHAFTVPCPECPVARRRRRRVRAATCMMTILVLYYRRPLLAGSQARTRARARAYRTAPTPILASGNSSPVESNNLVDLPLILLLPFTCYASNLRDEKSIDTCHVNVTRLQQQLCTLQKYMSLCMRTYRKMKRERL